MNDYLDALGKALLDQPEDAMLLPELDGFLAGLIVAPDPIEPARWLKRIWGGGLPDFENERALARFVALVTRHYEDVEASFLDSGAFDPIIDVDPRNGDVLWELWIDGFAESMRLASTGWNRLRRNGDATANAALDGMIHLIDFAAGALDPTEAEAAEWHRDAPARIALLVQTLYDWRRDPTRNTVTAKVGRNDPCPCGSGKKHKKCCGVS